MSFPKFLMDNGWAENQPFHFRKGEWTVAFDTSSWIEVGTIRNPRIFDVPVPQADREKWTLDLIEHLCLSDDLLQKQNVN